MPVNINEKYGMLTTIYVLKERTKSRGKIFHCKCDCGNEIDVPAASLITGNTKSCGCLHAKALKANGEKVRKRNSYDLTHEYGIGYAYNTNRPFYFDLEDYDLIKDYHWIEKENTGYIKTIVWDKNKPHNLFLHRLIMSNYYEIDKKDIDHINHETNDNRKSNLRACEHYQNNSYSKNYKNNTSGRKGVYWDKSRNKWAVWITHNKKHIYLGRYENFEDAVKVREKAEQEYHKDFHYDESKRDNTKTNTEIN